ncbi:hypothetical protein LJR029_000890 [Caballeronia sp. LjRoot29]|uniref:hypothetical protein n=1 Tax=unclassified Caballeronia TaxID=2646786 RepID=UPI003ECD0EC8
MGSMIGHEVFHRRRNIDLGTNTDAVLLALLITRAGMLLIPTSYEITTSKNKSTFKMVEQSPPDRGRHPARI